MADNHDIRQESIADLYTALMMKDYKNVAKVCYELPDGPLQRISLHNDTVLHVAAHAAQSDVVLKLLKMLPEDPNQTLADIKNNDGNTILHEAATSHFIDVTEELLRRDAGLLIACNNLGEKPIFCAARYGQTLMFDFLAWKMGLERQSPEDCKAHLQRNDGTTVLHISIATECFHLALLIAKRYPFLIEERDQSSITALQYLACNPTAFRRGKRQIRRGFIEQLSKSKIEARRGSMGEVFMGSLNLLCIVPLTPLSSSSIFIYSIILLSIFI